jgi:hypothetical protein
MKILLIFIFIVLLVYLIVHMCGGFRDPETRVLSSRDNHKSVVILDNLFSLNDEELHRLGKNLHEIKHLLDTTGEADPKHARRGISRKTVRLRKNATRPQLSARDVLARIRREIRSAGALSRGGKPGTGAKYRIVIVQVLLLLITALMVFL